MTEPQPAFSPAESTRCLIWRSYAQRLRQHSEDVPMPLLIADPTLQPMTDEEVLSRSQYSESHPDPRTEDIWSEWARQWIEFYTRQTAQWLRYVTYLKELPEEVHRDAEALQRLLQAWANAFEKERFVLRMWDKLLDEVGAAPPAWQPPAIDPDHEDLTMSNVAFHSHDSWVRERFISAFIMALTFLAMRQFCLIIEANTRMLGPYHPKERATWHLRPGGEEAVPEAVQQLLTMFREDTPVLATVLENADLAAFLDIDDARRDHNEAERVAKEEAERLGMLEKQWGTRMKKMMSTATKREGIEDNERPEPQTKVEPEAEVVPGEELEPEEDDEPKAWFAKPWEPTCSGALPYLHPVETLPDSNQDPPPAVLLFQRDLKQAMRIKKKKKAAIHVTWLLQNLSFQDRAIQGHTLAIKLALQARDFVRTVEIDETLVKAGRSAHMAERYERPRWENPPSSWTWRFSSQWPRGRSRTRRWSWGGRDNGETSDQAPDESHDQRPSSSEDDNAPSAQDAKTRWTAKWINQIFKRNASPPDADTERNMTETAKATEEATERAPDMASDDSGCPRLNWKDKGKWKAGEEPRPPEYHQPILDIMGDEFARAQEAVKDGAERGPAVVTAAPVDTVAAGATTATTTTATVPRAWLPQWAQTLMAKRHSIESSAPSTPPPIEETVVVTLPLGGAIEEAIVDDAEQADDEAEHANANNQSASPKRRKTSIFKAGSRLSLVDFGFRKRSAESCRETTAAGTPETGTGGVTTPVMVSDPLPGSKSMPKWWSVNWSNLSKGRR